MKNAHLAAKAKNGADPAVMQRMYKILEKPRPKTISTPIVPSYVLQWIEEQSNLRIPSRMPTREADVVILPPVSKKTITEEIIKPEEVRKSLSPLPITPVVQHVPIAEKKVIKKAKKKMIIPELEISLEWISAPLADPLAEYIK